MAGHRHKFLHDARAQETAGKVLLGVGLAAFAIAALLYGLEYLEGKYLQEAVGTVQQTSGIARPGAALPHPAAREPQSAGRSLLVTYAFQTPDGQMITATRKVRPGQFARLRPGRSIIILYDPRKPSRSWIKGVPGSGPRTEQVFGCAAVGFGAAGLFLLLLSGLTKLRQRRALRPKKR